jgi:hypothetical protein
VLPVVDVRDLDWEAVRNAADAAAIRARMRDVVEQWKSCSTVQGDPA